jgi:hypothetical protein
MGRTYTIVGFGIVVPEKVFCQKFPHSCTVDESGHYDINRMKTDLVEVLVHSEGGGVFIVSTGYSNLGDSVGIQRIPYQELLQRGQILVPWFKEHFPGYEPGIYVLTEDTG